MHPPPTLTSWFRAAILAALLAASGAPAWGQAEPVPLERARSLERRVQAVIAHVRSAVVTIGVPGEPGADGGVVGLPRGVPIVSGGTGVVLSAARGLVLTCEHVTEGQDLVLVGLVDGRTFEGRVLGRDVVGDLALLQIPAATLSAEVTLGDSRAVNVGDWVVALGNPFGLAKDDHQPAATLGVVSGVHRYQDGSRIYGDALQIDASVNPGSSGGPILDLSGRLIGLAGRISIRGHQRHNVGVGFAIPAHQIALVLEQLEAGQDVRRGYLGVTFTLQPDPRGGVLLQSVIPGSPAALGGLRPGDRIVKVDGRPVEHPVRLQNAFSILPEGTQVPLEIVREGATRTLRVTLGARAEGR